ncbi:MAG: ATP-binding cassette domain-containing protein [Oscillospiraceae bacterium]|jgi:ABC-2 type transport system ATP-binding protein|nr:ATP-binding cassette domain-containing protein [Oscillospiraceae bacterium]
MSPKVQTDTSRTDSAVSIRGVTKTFTQWQRDNTGRGLLKNLLKPEKRVVTALDNVSFEIKKGEFVAYAGPNGAGKSTTMKLLSGMLLPASGGISVLGMSPHRQRRAVMQKLGVLFGNRTELWWDHPVIQSFAWKKVVWDIPDALYRENLAMVTELLDIGGLLKTFARELSLGQRMRADLAMLLLHSPALILLDEPTLGLDVVAKRQMIGFLKQLNERAGTTIVVTSHDMDDLEEMARRILLVSGGKIAFDGGFAALRNELGCTKRAAVNFHDGTHREIDYQDTRSLLRELSAMDGVADVSFTQTSLEEGLANLFAKWKNQRP